jgi:bifunctional DNA-binding transcriptional regulator/antitoxin component of YhaV-PrlF toxin-antitoxin module
MADDGIEIESMVSGNRATIPARIRRELDIDDGEQLRWQLEADGSVRVQILHQRSGTFADFDGYTGDEPTDVVRVHDAFGVESK